MSKYQEPADRLFKLLEKTRRQLEALEVMTCEDAEPGKPGAEIAEAANAHVTLALSAVMLAKGEATKAGNLMPDVSVRFGGDGKN